MSHISNLHGLSEIAALEHARDLYRSLRKMNCAFSGTQTVHDIAHSLIEACSEKNFAPDYTLLLPQKFRGRAYVTPETVKAHLDILADRYDKAYAKRSMTAISNLSHGRWTNHVMNPGNPEADEFLSI